MSDTEIADKLRDIAGSGRVAWGDEIGLLHAAADIVEKHAELKGKLAGMEEALNKIGSDYIRMQRERDPLAAENARLKNELDDWHNAAAHVEADHKDEVHCGCVPVLRKLNNDLKAENARLRDAAQAVIERWESPAWKEAEPTAAVIYRLRDELGH